MVGEVFSLGATRVWTTVLASFAASLVECVEALTVVLAVGMVRGWRNALAGAGAALALLAGIVVALGPALMRVPLRAVQLVVGAMILLFGIRWLRKAVLRAAGLIPLHDEEAAYAKNTVAMGSAAGARGGWDRVALAASFQITMMEGTEVVFIVIAFGAGGTGLLRPAAAGAVLALAVVSALGLLLHRPLARVPENTLKFAVGVLLAAFGTFWIGEGAGLEWPGPATVRPDLAIPALVAAYLCIGLWLVPVCRTHAGINGVEGGTMVWLRSILRELYGLFVDDGSLAIALLAWTIGGVAVLRMLPLGHWGGPAFFAGLALLSAENILRVSRRMR